MQDRSPGRHKRETKSLAMSDSPGVHISSPEAIPTPRVRNKSTSDRSDSTGAPGQRRRKSWNLSLSPAALFRSSDGDRTSGSNSDTNEERFILFSPVNRSASSDFAIQRTTNIKVLVDVFCADLQSTERWKALIPSTKDRIKLLSTLIYSDLKFISQNGGDLWEYHNKETNDLLGITAWLPPSVKINSSFNSAEFMTTIGPTACHVIAKYLKKYDKWLNPFLSKLGGWFLSYIALHPSCPSVCKVQLFAEMAAHPDCSKIGKRPIVIHIEEVFMDKFSPLGFTPPKLSDNPVIRPERDHHSLSSKSSCDSPVPARGEKRLSPSPTPTPETHGIFKVKECPVQTRIMVKYPNEEIQVDLGLRGSRKDALSLNNSLNQSSASGVDDDWADCFTKPKEESSPQPIIAGPKLFSLLFDQNSSPSYGEYKPVLTLKEGKGIPEVLTRVNGQRLSTLAILNQSKNWSRSNYHLIPQPEIFTSEISLQRHLIWIIKHKVPKFEGQIPFSLVFAYVQGFWIIWHELSAEGYNSPDTWKPVEMLPNQKFQWVEKDGSLNISACTKYVKSQCPDASAIKLVENTPEVQNAIYRIDSLRTVNLKTLDLGVLLVPEGATTIQNLVSKKNLPSQRFLDFLPVLGVPNGEEGIIEGEDGVKMGQWHGYNVKWLLGHEMSKDDRRRRIGNSMCLVLFYDSIDTSFDITQLFLGQVSTFVCVVQPNSSAPDNNHWKLSFFVHCEQKFNTSGNVETQMHQHDSYVCESLCQFPPQIPEKFLFDEHCISDFILTKCFNARLNASSQHYSIRLQFALPVGTQLEVLAKQIDPSLVKA